MVSADKACKNPCRNTWWQLSSSLVLIFSSKRKFIPLIRECWVYDAQRLSFANVLMLLSMKYCARLGPIPEIPIDCENSRPRVYILCCWYDNDDCTS